MISNAALMTRSNYFGPGLYRLCVFLTRRERLKSAPYLRLKKRKRLFLKKNLKFFFRNFIEFFFSKNQKNGLSGAPGPASASPWRAKRGTLPKLSTFLLQLKEESFGEKTNFRKKVSQCRKTERGDPLGFLNTQCVVKYQRN